VGPQPGNPQALNRYSYVLNRPLAGGDPTGHQGPVPGVGTLPWQSGLSLPPISPDAVRALSVAGPYVAPVVIAGGTVVVAGGGSYYVTMWAIQDNGPDYTVPLEFDPGTVNATYTPPGFSTLTAPTMIGISPQVYAQPVPKGNRGNDWGRNANLDRTYNPDPKQTAHYGQKPPNWFNFPVGKPPDWKYWLVLLLGSATAARILGQCDIPPEQPGILEIVEPTSVPKAPTPFPTGPSWRQPFPSSYQPNHPQVGPGGKIPVEAW